MINVCEVLLVGHMRTSLFRWLASSTVMSPLVTASWREAIEEKSPFLKQNAPLPPCCGRLRYIQAPPLLTVLKTLLWCEAQRLQRSSIQRRLHHGDPSHPARGPFAPLPSGCAAWSSSQLLPRGGRRNSTHHWMLSHPAACLFQRKAWKWLCIKSLV